MLPFIGQQAAGPAGQEIDRGKKEHHGHRPSPGCLQDVGPVAVVEVDAGDVHAKGSVAVKIDPVLIVESGEPLPGKETEIEAKNRGQQQGRQQHGCKIICQIVCDTPQKQQLHGQDKNAQSVPQAPAATALTPVLLLLGSEMERSGYQPLRLLGCQRCLRLNPLAAEELRYGDLHQICQGLQ